MSSVQSRACDRLRVLRYLSQGYGKQGYDTLAQVICMALSAEDREKVRSALMNALVNISRKYQGVTASELKMLFHEVMQELERKGLIRRAD